MAKAKTSIERPVLITTEFRGVFFGFATDTNGDTVTLRNARSCIYWSTSVGGFMGLATVGPNRDCKIGTRVEQIELRKVTAVVEVTAEAVAAWEAAPAVK